METKFPVSRMVPTVLKLARDEVDNGRHMIYILKFNGTVEIFRLALIIWNIGTTVSCIPMLSVEVRKL